MNDYTAMFLIDVPDTWEVRLETEEKWLEPADWQPLLRVLGPRVVVDARRPVTLTADEAGPLAIAWIRELGFEAEIALAEMDSEQVWAVAERLVRYAAQFNDSRFAAGEMAEELYGYKALLASLSLENEQLKRRCECGGPSCAS